MGTQKHRNLTVDNLTVTGTLTAPEGALGTIEVHNHPGPALPVAPHPLPLPEKTTMAALRDRVEFLTDTLIAAGLIHHVPRRDHIPAPGQED